MIQVVETKIFGKIFIYDKVSQKFLVKFKESSGIFVIYNFMEKKKKKKRKMFETLACSATERFHSLMLFVNISIVTTIHIARNLLKIMN